MEKQLFIMQLCKARQPKLLSDLKGAVSLYEFLGAFAGIRRKLDGESFAFLDSDKSAWEEFFGQAFPKHWQSEDWARIWFLLQIADVDIKIYTEAVNHLLRRGDHSEQVSLMRVLFYLPDGEQFVDLAQKSLATNSSEIFTGLALANPYPASFFTDLFFQQMVLKALFIDLPTNLIIGLKERVSPELVRMADDYVREREIANRKAPRGYEYLKSLSE